MVRISIFSHKSRLCPSGVPVGWVWIGDKQDSIEKDGLKVYEEPVKIPSWVRGQEYATLLSPRVKNVRLLGLGGSVGTPGGKALVAKALVVSSFEELEKRSKEVAGSRPEHTRELSFCTLTHKGRPKRVGERVCIRIYLQIAADFELDLFLPNRKNRGLQCRVRLLWRNGTIPLHRGGKGAETRGCGSSRALHFSLRLAGSLRNPFLCQRGFGTPHKCLIMSG